MKTFIFVVGAFVLIASFQTLLAQSPSVSVDVQFLGVERPTIQESPLPAFPELAKTKGLDGDVRVPFTVDRTGKVTVGEATGPYPVCKAVSNPEVLALRASALSAARKTVFKINENVANSAVGWLFYKFDLHKKPVAPGVLGGINKATDASPIVRVGSSSESGAELQGDTASKLAGGVLNGKATSLGKPAYPAAAKAVHAGGAVTVYVVIDEGGKIFSAKAVAGHPLLRAASEIAACNSTFLPTLLSGQPVRVSGVITYNFVP